MDFAYDRKMVNKIKPGVIDERKLTRGRTMNTFQLSQNLGLTIQGCKELGLKVLLHFPVMMSFIFFLWYSFFFLCRL